LEATGASGATSTSRAATHPHGLHLLGELRELAAVEFAIAVSVKLHRVLDEPFRRRRPAPLATRTAALGRATALGGLGDHHPSPGECHRCHDQAGDSHDAFHDMLLLKKVDVPQVQR
jgi:hypothetical protein